MPRVVWHALCDLGLSMTLFFCWTPIKVGVKSSMAFTFLFDSVKGYGKEFMTRFFCLTLIKVRVKSYMALNCLIKVRAEAKKRNLATVNAVKNGPILSKF